MSLAEKVRAHKAKAMGNLNEIVRQTVMDSAERIIQLSPLGDPTLWKSAPPADYRPGRFQSNWNYSTGEIDRSTTMETEARRVDLALLPEDAAGKRHLIANSVEYAQALEYGHSPFQAPAGIIAVIATELTDIAYTAARRVAA